jgi:hypothetical protein
VKFIIIGLELKKANFDLRQPVNQKKESRKSTRVYTTFMEQGNNLFMQEK